MAYSSDKKPTLRRSQTITTFGVGAIVDLPDASAMVCGIEKWNTKGCIPLHDARLETKLNASHFYMPPSTEESAEGVIAVRFPRYLRCRKCNYIRDINVWRDRAAAGNFYKDFDVQPYCDIDKIQLIPSRFVVACRRGHIDDFPYEQWVHGDALCNNPSLKYIETASTVGLGGILIKCDCGKSQSMAASFNKDKLANIASCRGAKPWVMEWSSQCGEQLVALQRGGTNVHFPILRSSILIPPYSSEGLRKKIVSSDLWGVYESQSGGIEIDTLIPAIAQEIGESTEDVRTEIGSMLNTEEQDDKAIPEEEYRFEEYEAFTGNVTIDKQYEKDFLIEKVPTEGYKIPLIKNVVLAKRLREVRVQVGFSRIKPPTSHDETGQAIPDEEKIDAVPVSQNRRIRWYPGYEVRGEGIFLEFDTKELKSWAATAPVQKRLKDMLDRSSKHPDSFGVLDTLTPEYLALHTLSHLLIKQLSFECGYSSSALRERIYASSPRNSSVKPMSAILIYTAEGDSDGTLGGLVRQGKADLFNDTFRKAIHQAEWCASDPLCIESDGQGYLGMNLAACHACTMLPETSCEMLNRYLDRGTIVGTLTYPNTGLFSGMTRGAK